MAKDIFFSYGHDEYYEFIEFAKKVLENEKFNVIIDTDILHASDDWEEKLEQSIKQSNKVVFFITPHSARRPDGYCLNEIAYALSFNKEIIPVMIAYETPPLSIIRLQYLDIQDIVKKRDFVLLEKKIKEIIDIVRNKKKLDNEGTHAQLINQLEPINFKSDFASHKKIIGRKWIRNKIEQWIKESPHSRVLWLTAEAGYGKSAIAAYLAHNHEDVIGVHFCKYNEAEKRNNARNIIKTIAYYLSNYIDGYFELIQNIEINKIKNSYELFDVLLYDPLSNLPPQNEKNYFIVIDALDEALHSNYDEIADLLNSDFVKLPNYVKIIVTSRPEVKLRQIMSKLEAVELKVNDTNNIEDCVTYIRYQMPVELQNREDLIHKILEHSSANMLYLNMFFEEVKNKRIDLEEVDKFPLGLNGVYKKYFDRIIKDEDEYDQTFAPLLEIIIAYNEPIEQLLLEEISGFGKKKTKKAIERLSTIISQQDGKLSLFHKSLEDWLTMEENVSYFVDVNEGERRISNFFLNLNNKNYKSEYIKYERFNIKLIDFHYDKYHTLNNFFALLKNGIDIIAQVKLLNNAGSLYNLLNQTTKAIFCLEYVLHVEEQANEIDPLEHMRTLEKLAILYWKIEATEKSLQLRERYIAYSKKYYDNKKSSEYALEYSKALYLMSSAYVRLSRLEEAEKLRKQVLKIRTEYYKKKPNEWMEYYTTSLLGMGGYI